MVAINQVISEKPKESKIPILEASTAVEIFKENDAEVQIIS